MVVVLATVLGHYTTVIHVYRSWHIGGGSGCVHSYSWCVAVILLVHRGSVLVAPIIVRIIRVMIIAIVIILLLLIVTHRYYYLYSAGSLIGPYSCLPLIAYL